MTNSYLVHCALVASWSILHILVSTAAYTVLSLLKLGDMMNHRLAAASVVLDYYSILWCFLANRREKRKKKTKMRKRDCLQAADCCGLYMCASVRTLSVRLTAPWLILCCCHLRHTAIFIPESETKAVKSERLVAVAGHFSNNITNGSGLLETWNSVYILN